MRRHPVVAFFVIACVVSWLAVAPLVAAAMGWFDLGWSPTWHSLGALGPVTAAVIVTAVVSGRAGLAEFWNRLVRWRVGVRCWLLALSPLALGGVAYVALRASGAPLEPLATLGRGFRDPAWVTGMFLASLAYGLGEEPGWRGFALPRLQYGRSALWATTILTVGWGLWHVPYFFYRYHFQSGAEYLGFYLGLFAGAVWLTFLYNSARGSTLIVVVWHTVWNAVALAAAILSPTLVAITSALIMMTGIAALLVGGPRRLSRAEPHVIPPQPAGVSTGGVSWQSPKSPKSLRLQRKDLRTPSRPV